MPTSKASSTKKVKPVTVKPSAPSEKTRAGRKKAPDIDSAPSEPVEGEIPPTTPASIQPSPKKRSRKRKLVTDTGDLPPENTDDPAANRPAGKKGPGLKSKAPVPTRDTLPPREGRNTHPGLQDGIQPTPRRSSQDVAADREKKRLELEAKLRVAEEAKQILAQMELEDERLEEEVEEEGHRQLFCPNGQSSMGVVSSDEEIEGVYEVDYSEGEEEDEPEPEKEVSRYRGICYQILTIEPGKRKGQR